MRNTILAAALVIAICAVPASAGLIGQAVDVSYLYPDQSTVYRDLGSGTVTAGGFTSSFGQHNYTVTDTQVTLKSIADGPDIFTNATFNGFELTETGGSPVTITGFTVDAATDVSGFSPLDVTFDSTHVWLNMQGLTTDTGQEVVLDLEFGPASVTPEPATFGFVGLGLAAAALLRRLRR